MRFLSVLGLGRVLARPVRHVAAVVALRDRPARGADRLGRHIDAVGSHVGDQALLVEPLGDPHRMACCKAELPGCFLLKRGGREWRRRVPRKRLGFDRGDGEASRFDCHPGAVRVTGIADRQAIDLLPVEFDKAGGETLPVRFEVGRYRPIFLRLETIDLAFPIDDQAEGDRLYPARGFCAWKLSPKDRRQRETDQIVERAPRLVGVDQILVEFARIRHRFGDCRLGNGVERDPLHIGRQDLLLLQHLGEMPADRLALAIGVGGEDQRVRALCLVSDCLELLRAIGRHLPFHREVVVRIDRTILRRKVAHVPERREHPMTRAQVFLDGFRLGGRFDDDELQAISSHMRIRDGVWGFEPSSWP